jgi:2-methylcitrate dehydratase
MASRIACSVASRVEVPCGARVFGTRQRSLPELATFANGVMARLLDGNDVFPGGGGHPSDVIPAVLAAVDVAGADRR